MFLTFIASRRQVPDKLASFPPVVRDAPKVKSELVGSKCYFVNVDLFIIFAAEKIDSVFDGNSCSNSIFSR